MIIIINFFIFFVFINCVLSYNIRNNLTIQQWIKIREIMKHPSCTVPTREKLNSVLFDKYEDRQEGFLTKARTKLVRGNMLASIARGLELDKWILMDEKGIRNGWNQNEKVLEDALEALIGAIYMDLGLLHTKKFVLGLFSDPNFVDLDCIMVDDNYKDRLMRYCQANKLELPEYPVINHVNGVFCIGVCVNGATLGYGSAKSKKQAEQTSAYEALVQLKEI
jgi:ribonuclease-3